MNEPLSQETSTLESKFVNIACGSCDRKTRHKVLAETDIHLQDPEGNVDLWEQYQIVQCQGCFTISFSVASQFSENLEYNPHTGEQFIPTERSNFPNHITGRPILQETYYLPRTVYSIYKEAHSALCGDLKIMTGLGIRATIEAICKDNSMSGRTLQQQIDSLTDAGLITSSGADILHNLRFMGNAAAHEMIAHNSKELNAAFDVVEYLLKGVYILPKQAEDLPNRES